MRSSAVDRALELHDLRFRYGRRDAVRGVSLALESADCYGFLGHNGAGKTTVMRLALGLLRPNGGAVRIFGVDALRSPRLARAGVGALIERPGFHLHASAHRNLAWLAQLRGMPRRLAAADASRTLELLGLGSSAGRRVGTFSLGMRQRLGVAAALLGRPRLLLLDEPTSGLDPEGIADLRAVLQELRGDGTAVLLSSHQLSELDGLCNRIGILREGAMVAEGDLESLRRRFGARHVVAGTPLPTLQGRLTALGLAPVPDGDRLVVELGDRAPGPIVRDLATAGDLTSFAPEPVTLEAIYLSVAKSTPTPAPPLAPVPSGREPPWPMPARPLARAFGHELRTLCARTTTAPLLLAPIAVAVWSVVAYSRRVDTELARVAAGQLFSADAGSGFVATARALQAAVPALALVALWCGSQTFAAEIAGDTLRNTLMLSVDRRDVLLAKVGAVVTAVFAGFAALVAATSGLSWLLAGFGDLEEVTRHGDRQLLAAANGVLPVLWPSLLHCVPPLFATATVGVAASIVAKRPARALAFALFAMVAQEGLRDVLGSRAGWLLTSHLPTGLLDESALAFSAAIARGAADAFWRWSDVAPWAPLAWFAAAFFLAASCFRRLAVA